MKEIQNSFGLTWIAPWKVVKNAAGHHTWHQAINNVQVAKVRHFGMQDSSNPDWLQPLFNQSIKKRFQTVSPCLFHKLMKEIGQDKSKLRCVVIFEGSMFWAFLLAISSIFHPRVIFICNLWPSSKYLDLATSNFLSKKWMNFVLRVIGNFNRLQITVDTTVLAEFLCKEFSSDIKAFPVPSSLEFRLSERKDSLHKKVLLNIREFDLSRLRDILQNSCQHCVFHISYNKDNFAKLSEFFKNQKNLVIENVHVEVEQYESYIDSFDHAVFLYQPLALSPRSFSHFCASGRLLDVLLRRIPVSIPVEGVEWVDVARRWGSVSTFDFDSDLSVAKEFNHPNFSKTSYMTPPPFTPAGVVKQLSLLSQEKLDSKHTREHFGRIFPMMNAIIAYFTILTHWSLSMLLNIGYLIFRLFRSLIFRNRLRLDI